MIHWVDLTVDTIDELCLLRMDSAGLILSPCPLALEHRVAALPVNPMLISGAEKRLITANDYNER